VALRGTFTETDPEDLLQILALGGKTGVLTVLHQGRAARLVFEGGEIIDAVDGSRRGEEVVFSLLVSRAGSFVFTPESVATERTIHRRVPALLLSAAQRVDDLARANGLLSKPSARVYLPQAVNPEEVADFGEVGQKLLQYVDGRRSVGEIVSGADVDVSRAYAVLAGLLDRGVIGVVGAEDEDSPLLTGTVDSRAAAPSAPLDGGGPTRPPKPEELREVADYLRRAACAVGEVAQP